MIAYITPRGDEDRRFVERVKTGDVVTFKGVIDDVTLRNLDIKPAILVRERQVPTSPASQPQQMSATSTPGGAIRIASLGNTRKISSSTTEHQSERKIVQEVFAADFARAKSEFPSSSPEIDVATIDLNDDGESEIIADISGSGFCGSGGCKVSILSRQPNGAWQEIGNFLGGTGNWRVSSVKTNGYKVIVWGDVSELRFENGQYEVYVVSNARSSIRQGR